MTKSPSIHDFVMMRGSEAHPVSASSAGQTAFALGIRDAIGNRHLFPSADDFFEVGDGLLQPVFE